MADWRPPLGNGPVPAVDPVDLRALFAMLQADGPVADAPESDGIGVKGFNLRWNVERK